MTYPDPAVQQFIAEQFVPLRLMINRRVDQPIFRAYQVIWTPTVAVLDRRGVARYQSPGFLPPDAFLASLRIGLARAMLAWGRYHEAATQLSTVADDAANPLAPEALYWLGVAFYLPTRSRAELMRAWRRLRDEYPTSLWALRVPPNQESAEE